MSALLFNAFRALGTGLDRREIARVAAALRDSGDREVGPLLDYQNHPERGSVASRLPRKPAPAGSLRST